VQGHRNTPYQLTQFKKHYRDYAEQTKATMHTSRRPGDMPLLKLSEQFSSERLESACSVALGYTPRPSYKAIQTILKSGRDKLPETEQTPSAPSKHSFTRGSDYYKGGRGDAE
jgi:hypothetical protein